MIELAGELKAIWFLIAAALGGVIWLVRLEGRVNTAIRDLGETQRNVKRLYDRSDRIDVLEKQVATVTSMMKPEALAEYHRSDERIKARLDYLEEKVGELRRKGYDNV